MNFKTLYFLFRFLKHISTLIFHRYNTRHFLDVGSGEISNPGNTKKTTKDKQNTSPYCSCGDIQLSRRRRSPICLETIMLTLRFYPKYPLQLPSRSCVYLYPLTFSYFLRPVLSEITYIHAPSSQATVNVLDKKRVLMLLF